MYTCNRPALGMLTDDGEFHVVQTRTLFHAEHASVKGYGSHGIRVEQHYGYEVYLRTRSESQNKPGLSV